MKCSSDFLPAEGSPGSAVAVITEFNVKKILSFFQLLVFLLDEVTAGVSMLLSVDETSMRHMYYQRKPGCGATPFIFYHHA